MTDPIRDYPLTERNDANLERWAREYEARGGELSEATLAKVGRRLLRRSTPEFETEFDLVRGLREVELDECAVRLPIG